jgi:hypothetical protein
MPKKKAYFRKPGRPTRVVSWRTAEKTTEARPHRPIPVESVVVDEGVWDSVKKGEAEAFKRLANLVSAAAEEADEKRLGWRLIVRMDPERRIPKFEIEGAGPKPAGYDDLDTALTEARAMGVSRAVEILSQRDMLSAADFGKFIGVSREAVRTKYQRNEVLGLQGAKRGLRYPKWQVTSDGGLLPELPRLFEVLGGESWTVYRFLTQHHPELEGDTALSALRRGKVEKVLAAAENTAGAFS